MWETLKIERYVIEHLSYAKLLNVMNARLRDQSD